MSFYLNTKIIHKLRGKIKNVERAQGANAGPKLGRAMAAAGYDNSHRNVQSELVANGYEKEDHIMHGPTLSIWHLNSTNTW